MQENKFSKIKNLHLDGVSYDFELMRNYIYYKDGMRTYYWAFWDTNTINIIGFTYTTYEDLKENCDDKLLQIINGTRMSAYKYLVEKLNTCKWLYVDWGAIPDTTSDYKIIHVDSSLEDREKADGCGYKYIEITEDGIRKLEV